RRAGGPIRGSSVNAEGVASRDTPFIRTVLPPRHGYRRGEKRRYGSLWLPLCRASPRTAAHGKAAERESRRPLEFTVRGSLNGAFSRSEENGQRTRFVPFIVPVAERRPSYP